MSTTTTDTTVPVLMGVEDTTPQTQHFDSVREFDDDDVDDDDDEESFVDVDVKDDENDINTSQILGDPSAIAASTATPDDHEEDHGDDDDEHLEMTPLIIESDESPPPSPMSRPSAKPTKVITQMRSRFNKSTGGGNESDDERNKKSLSIKACLKRKKSREDGLHRYHEVAGADPSGGQYSSNLLDASGHSSAGSEDSSSAGGGGVGGRGPVTSAMARCCRESSTHFLRTTVSLMNFLARVLLWGSFIAMIIGVVWYSRELKMNGTDPHLIAWFSAGAFVLLGFPISMCGIIMHLKNYYQPNVQCYVVRILWMVPIYSIESWLCLRFHTLAIYIETLRDCYESYVLYSFFQFLIEVLGGEETLVLMLKDKSPTRGAHIWGLGYCMKPWIMGQPVSKRMSYTPEKMRHPAEKMRHHHHHGGMGGAAAFSSNGQTVPMSPMTAPGNRPIKRVQWTSPFFVKCKFGVLQYVLLKFVSAIFVMVLEMCDLYKEGDFTPRGGYLYICILTNLSQCWALYCLVFFYYALKNELGPIRPVGKFLSVKALVFFTWWQSLGISILFQMGMIPRYTSFDNDREWSAEAVAKGLQDWLICIEMFCAAIIHTFVFPHTDYLEPLGIMEQRASSHMTGGGVRRLGRKGRMGYRKGDDKSACSKGSGGSDIGVGFDLESGPVDSSAPTTQQSNNEGIGTIDESDKESTSSGMADGENRRHKRQGFVRALLDSTLPSDVLDQSVGIFKGDFHVEKKTLLHHAATSDEYDLFSQSSKRRKAKLRSAGSAATPLRKSKEKEAGVPDSVLLNE